MSAAMLSIDEAAEYIGVSRGTLFKLLRDGEITSVKVGKSRRFRQEWLDEFIAENTERKGARPVIRTVTCRKCGHAHQCSGQTP